MFLSCLLLASVELASPFSDHMVLQRGMKVPVWGTALPGERVTVSFAGQKLSATAGRDGTWRVDLKPLTASTVGRVLTASDSSKSVKTVADVLVGEVWLCAGQSNMGVPLCGDRPHFRDGQGMMVAQVTRRPLIRFVATPADRYDAVPQAKTQKPLCWRSFTPQTLMNSSFSAVATYFGLSVQEAIGIPVGLVGVYRGATGIDSWTPSDGKPVRTKDRDDCQPGVFWNTVVNPWAPFAVRGMIWYQGEHDSDESSAYPAKLRKLYDGWRTRFENPNLKFYYSQLCSWGSDIAAFQEAQASFEREEPNAAMAVINDVGNPTDIHPNVKEPVGRRLALHAIRRDYGREFGFEHVQDNSPSVSSASVSGSVVTVSFENARSLYLYNRDFSTASGFELAGADGKWKPARILNLAPDNPKAKKLVYQGRLTEPKVLLAAEDVPTPVRVRYLHSKPWIGNLFNEANLPLAAFWRRLDLSAERRK